MLYVGTSGFSYDDWRGQWYPPNLPRNKYFNYYAERFEAVEINSTFYHIYSPRMMESLVGRAEGRVRFSVKMTKLITHQGMLNRAIVLSYAAGLEPARREGVLSSILLQFPQRFYFTKSNRTYLNKVLRIFHEFPLVVEIRHDSWQSDEALRFFTDHQINLCLTDMPSLRGLPRTSHKLTGHISYIRFHGRNSRQWWGEEYPGGRYDYFYSEDELEPWVGATKTLVRKADTALVFFNNHVAAKAAINAEMFMGSMGQKIRKPGYRDMFSRNSQPDI